MVEIAAKPGRPTAKNEWATALAPNTATSAAVSARPPNPAKIATRFMRLPSLSAPATLSDRAGAAPPPRPVVAGLSPASVTATRCGPAAAEPSPIRGGGSEPSALSSARRRLDGVRARPAVRLNGRDSAYRSRGLGALLEAGENRDVARRPAVQGNGFDDMV